MGSTQEQFAVRSAARRKALQILFQGEITGQGVDDILVEGFCSDEVGVPCDFTLLLLKGVENNRQAIDELIAQTSENWSLERMPLVDRSILRLATFEMLYVDEVPCSVSINEAVELAKSFGGEDESSRFVNGVLGRIASHLYEDKGPDEGPQRKKATSKREKKALHG